MKLLNWIQEWQIPEPAVVADKPHSWSKRNVEIVKYIPNNCSVIDFGCGNREILGYLSPTKYLGIDIEPTANIVADLNQMLPTDIPQGWDVGLLLGVLEYVNDPDQTLKNIVGYADQFFVLSLITGKKHNWQRAWTPDTIDQCLRRHFASVEHHSFSKYILSVCKK